MILLYIALGGALGAVLRFGVAGWVQEWAGPGFPWGTLSVNALGSFSIGLAMRLLEVSRFGPEVRALVLVGLLGAFTTFSTFSYETLAFLQEGQWVRAGTYAAGSLVLGLAAVWTGHAGAGVVLQGRSASSAPARRAPGPSVAGTSAPEPPPHGEPGAAPGLRFTDSQRRHVELMLGSLVRETREVLRDWEREGIEGPDGRTVRRALERLLGDAEEAAERLGIRLAETPADPGRRLVAWSSTWWSAVLDSRPAALRAYGEVDPTTAEVMAPVVEGLAQRLLRVEALAREAGPAVRERRPGSSPTE